MRTRTENKPVPSSRARSGAIVRAVGIGLFVAGAASVAMAAEQSGANHKPDTQPAAKTKQNTSNPSAKDQLQGGSSDKKTAGFSYDKLVQRAESLAKQGYHAPAKVPPFLRDMSAHDLSQITYKRDRALWADGNRPFQAMFYHPGSFYEHAVKIHVVEDGQVRPFDFDRDRFDYPSPDIKNKVPQDVGYAGFKLLNAINKPDKKDEIMSFLGASYFRALAAGEHYGLSARGLAIDTGNTDKGEEFPNFTEFWLVRPAKNADHLTLYALLDSPSVTGAYKFVITPGKSTHTAIDSTLFTRKPIAKLGIAPLTSMFTWGENSLTRLDDYRPEAHDSGGMLISSANGEWLWRPLVNPQKLWLNQYNADNVRGFGLIQRDRNFDHYQDLSYEYENRPNAWITPKGDWGKGHVELVEIPSDSEVNDNIDLYWVPSAPVKAGQKLHFAYDIDWSSQTMVPDSLGHAVASHIGMAAVTPGQQKSQIKVVIDFVGGELGHLKDANAVQPRVNAGRDVTLHNVSAVRNPHTGGWRLSFLVPVSALDSPLGLRAYLADANGGGLTETWTYLLDKP